MDRAGRNRRKGDKERARRGPRKREGEGKGRGKCDGQVEQREKREERGGPETGR